LIYEGTKVEKQVPPSTRISALKAIISRIFGISVRKRKILIGDFGGLQTEVSEGDALKDIGWFVSGRKAEIIVV